MWQPTSEWQSSSSRAEDFGCMLPLLLLSMFPQFLSTANRISEAGLKNCSKFAIRSPSILRFAMRQNLEQQTLHIAHEDSTTPSYVPPYGLAANTASKYQKKHWCRECVSLIEQLGYPVKHIVLTTFAYEHKASHQSFTITPQKVSWLLSCLDSTTYPSKIALYTWRSESCLSQVLSQFVQVFVGPFSRKFPDAEVYTAPKYVSKPLSKPHNPLEASCGSGKTCSRETTIT